MKNCLAQNSENICLKPVPGNQIVASVKITISIEHYTHPTLPKEKHPVEAV